MSNSFDFADLMPQAVPLTLGGKRYVLREASAAAAARWRNAVLRSTKMDNGKVVSVDGLADAEPLLVSLCVFEVAADGVEKQVPLDTVRSWRASVVKALFEKAKAISELDEKDTKESLQEKVDRLRERMAELDADGGDAAKNALGATTDSSA
jgi:SpoU rRNA methylase family enzyme